MAKNEQKINDSDKAKLYTAGAAIPALTGSKTIANQYRSGNLDGVKKFYHGTKNENIDSIMQSGLKSHFAEDPKNLTNRVLHDIPMDEKKDLVYIAKHPKLAKGVNLARARNENPFNPLEGAKNSSILNVNIPVNDYKKMNIVDNPELLGAKTRKQYIKTKKSMMSKDPFQKILLKKSPILTDTMLKMNYNGLSRSGEVVKGDIPSKFIKGGAGYEKQTAKKVFEHIKSNPKMFAKGVGGTALGAAALGLSGKMLYDGYKLSHKEKTAKGNYCEQIEKIAMAQLK